MTALLNAEVRKVLGLRYWWILGIAPVVVGLFTGALTLPLARQVEDIIGEGFASTVSAAIGIALALALVFLFAAVFGAVNGGTEFQHRTMATTFLTTRGRDGVVAAKYVTAAAFGLLYCVVVEIAAVLTVLMFAGGDSGPSSGSDFGQLAAVLTTGMLCAALWALMGSGLGLLTGSTVGSVLAISAWVPFGELIVSLILHGLGLGAVADLLPVQLTWYTIVGVIDIPETGDMAVRWPGAPLALIGWTLLVCALGWWRVRSRDVG
ncbi:ABC transporter permease [Rhodococcus sp. HM1]|uniref:ABC transporter permease n=1 Tax=Rhodococcus sp. HM1 TaxID=2937759 RepID=UPI00200B7FB2|nr:ABC transporter permease [Rhodococcus sp. HM1]MCK8671860.1 ABC transporter permease [Rhodococcus sp. HM1]